MQELAKPVRVGTGVPGLDEVLRGGVPENRLYVVEGDPGAGKTTLAMQFLLEGVRLGEPVLYIALSETAEELREVAASHGWSLEGVEILELSALAGAASEDASYTVFHPADVELGETLRRVRKAIDELGPRRLVLDSVSELKILAESGTRYRRELLGIKQFVNGKECTVFILDDRTGDGREQQLLSIAHGVIRLERNDEGYGNTRRQIQVLKMRGVRYRDGLHDFSIKTGGLEVYTRLWAAEQTPSKDKPLASTGNPELDQMLGGGLDCATSTLLIGPSGCGKTTICSQCVTAALARGESAACFLFEESLSTFLKRSEGLGMPFQEYMDSGQLYIHEVDLANLTPGDFAHRVRAVVENGARIVVIDGLNGYLNGMPSERHLMIHMHELLTYLGQKGIITMLVIAQHGMIGGMHSPVDVSFLADTVILLRFFEAEGAVRQAISIVKKRRTDHERTIREMKIVQSGVRIGEPLNQFEGVLTGVPRFRGDDRKLLGGKPI